jgi:hypothetical protein
LKCEEMEDAILIIKNNDDLREIDEDEFINIACKKFIFSKNLIIKHERDFEKISLKKEE